MGTDQFPDASCPCVQDEIGKLTALTHLCLTLSNNITSLPVQAEASILVLPAVSGMHQSKKSLLQTPFEFAMLHCCMQDGIFERLAILQHLNLAPCTGLTCLPVRAKHVPCHRATQVIWHGFAACAILTICHADFRSECIIKSSCFALFISWDLPNTAVVLLHAGEYCRPHSTGIP